MRICRNTVQQRACSSRCWAGHGWTRGIGPYTDLRKWAGVGAERQKAGRRDARCHWSARRPPLASAAETIRDFGPCVQARPTVHLGFAPATHSARIARVVPWTHFWYVHVSLSFLLSYYYVSFFYRFLFLFLFLYFSNLYFFF